MLCAETVAGEIVWDEERAVSARLRPQRWNEAMGRSAMDRKEGKDGEEGTCYVA